MSLYKTKIKDVTYNNRLYSLFPKTIIRRKYSKIRIAEGAYISLISPYILHPVIRKGKLFQ